MPRYVIGLIVTICAAGGWLGLNALAPTAGVSSESQPGSDAEIAEPDPTAARDPSDAPSSGPRPRVAVDAPLHQFGTMHVGEEGTHVFVVRNTGDAPLELGEPNATCKCTLGTLESRTIPPGGSIDVTLEWNSAKVVEVFREGAEIPTNDPDQPLLLLAVEGRVEPLIVVSPSFHWDLGSFTGDEPQVVTGTVHSTLLEAFAITKAETTHPLFSARVQPLEPERREKLGAKSGYAIEVRVDPALPAGSAAATLKLRTDVDGAREIDVQVTAVREGPVRFLAAPGVRWNGFDQAVDLGRFPAEDGAAATLFMFVTEPAGEPFHITGVEVEPAYFQAVVTEDAGFQVPGRRRYEIRLAVPPGHPPDVRLRRNSAKVRLRTNHPSAPLVKVFVEYRSLASTP